MAKMTSGRNEPSRILLQTATAAFFNPDKPNQQEQGTIVFDTGSQQSYIVQKATESLQLRKQGTKLLSIAAFGSATSSPQSHDIVRVGLRKGTIFNRELALLVVPLICGPIRGVSREELSENSPYLNR